MPTIEVDADGATLCGEKMPLSAAAEWLALLADEVED